MANAQKTKKIQSKNISSLTPHQKSSNEFLSYVDTVYFKIYITSTISKKEIPALKNLLIEFKKITDKTTVEILTISIHNKILLFLFICQYPS